MRISILLATVLVAIQGCAEKPIHSNIFDPNTPNEPPEAVELKTDLISSITNRSITFGWTESGEEDFFSYNIYRSTNPGMDASGTLLKSHPYHFMNTFSDTGLQPNSPYYYKVYTEDKGGLTTGSNEMEVHTSPDIYYAGRLVTDGGGTENLFHYSKADVVVHQDQSHLSFAVLEKNWDLFLYVRAFDTDEPTDDGSSVGWAQLISGDSDGDGSPDLYEIIADSDRNRADEKPTYDVSLYPHVTPSQVVVFKDDDASKATLFVFFRHGDHYRYSNIIKFTGDWDTWTFEIDTTWFDDGVLRLRPCNAIARFSDDKLITGEGRTYRIFDLSGNELTSVDVDIYIGIISVGRDSPTGAKRIYLNNWAGEIYKFDEDGNLLKTWQTFEHNSGTLVPLGMFADSRGNLFVTDTKLNTVNRFDAEGNFISRWQGINADFNYLFHFNEQTAIYNHASLSGDNSSLYIVDMNSYRSRGTY